MKAALTFNLDDPDDRKNFRKASNADQAYNTLWEISQEIFRPARKHGYNDAELNKLIEDSGTYQDKEYGELGRGEEIISRLEKMFYEKLEENGVSLEDW